MDTIERSALGDGRALSHPLSRVWKILVLGNSVATVVVPPRASREDGAYPEVLERRLRQAGYDVHVRNSSRPFEQVSHGVRRFMEHERPRFPDVLVIQFGSVEYRQAVVPLALLKHLHTWDKGVRWPARAYRRLIVPRLWRLVRAYQRRVSELLGVRTWRTSPARFRRELCRLIEFAREDRMLVLVADGNPPGPRVLKFMPGLDRRWPIYQQVVADVVESFEDEEVRLVRISKVVDELGLADALPDGLHYSPSAHRRVADILAADIVPWLEGQTTRGSAPAP